MVLNDSYYEITYQISFIKIRIWGKPLKKEEQHLVQSGDKKTKDKQTFQLWYLPSQAPKD